MIQAGYVLLVLAIIACSLSFSAPFWVMAPDGWAGFVGLTSTLFTKWFGGTTKYQGLLASCTKDYKCTWLWESDFQWEKDIPDWFKASQGLFAAGLLMLEIGWIISTFHVCCCRCCKESFSVSSALGSLTLSGLVLIAASLTVYGAYAGKELSAGFNEGHVYFYWAFFVGIAGAVMALVSAILFFCDGCRNRSHVGYHMTRVV
jgi:hypothetical protein